MGTRRAAVMYGIPRSTLRNKVYKLSSEQKRETQSLDAEDEEKELSGEEDRDLDRPLNRLMFNTDEMIRSPRSTVTTAISNKYGQTFENSSPNSDQHQQSVKEMKLQDTLASAQSIPSNPWFDPMMFQNLLLAGGLMQKNVEDPSALQELIHTILLQQQELMKEQLKKTAPSPSDHLNNGKPNAASDQTRQLMHNFQLFQQQQLQNRLIKSETPDPTVDLNDSEDSAVILKIPSFKPVAGSSSSSGKNGENTNDSTPQTTPPLHSRSPHTHMSTGISPPINRHNNESQSPPMGMGIKVAFSLQDAIAQNISRSLNPQNSETINKPSMEQLEYHKRPSISVIKNLGGTDMTRFGASPNLMAMNSNNSNSQSALNNSGGKGTRPKRGKYRNYDRDSLVEAVKAVQRGEMSVHRAGSYYGVPHSTLEYKVKERHLMRPRKREPKPQPLDGTGSSASSSSIKNHEISGSAAANLRTIDKSKSLSSVKPPMKTPPFPSSSPNGLKMGLFDPLSYSQLFWSPASAYSGLPIDFAQRSSGTNAAFPNNADSLFASQMLRLQEGMRQANTTNPSAKTPTPSLNTAATVAAAVAAATATTNMTSAQKNQTKSEHEMAIESLYEGSGENGSFLDGIIRSSLHKKSNDSIPHGALLDQLVKNKRHFTSDGNSDCNNGNNNKRPGSPFNLTAHGIKRERNSSSSGETDRESVDERDISKE